MNKIQKAILLLFLFAIAMPLAARGVNEEEIIVEEAAPETFVQVQVTGIVRLVGSSHFPELVITGSERSWHITKEDEAKLFDLQHRHVTVEGEESVRELRFANGMSAGIRRELRNVIIIDIQDP